MSKMKSETLLKMFTTYCMEHPEEGFWRALCKWSGYSVLISPLPDGGQTLDTFNLGDDYKEWPR